MAKGQKTGGRKKGTPNKANVAKAQVIKEMAIKLQAVIPHVFQGNAHELLIAVYKNEDLALETRIEAAKAAIGFEVPKLASVEHKGDPDNPLETVTRIELSAPEGNNGSHRTAPETHPGIYGRS